MRRPGGPFGGPGPDVPEASLHWDRRYAADEKIWGDGPSLLAQLTVARLRPYAHRFILAASCNTAINARLETLLDFRDAWRELASH